MAQTDKHCEKLQYDTIIDSNYEKRRKNYDTVIDSEQI